MSLESLRGKIVVLNFWASWCVPACYEEAPTLERTWLTLRPMPFSMPSTSCSSPGSASIS